MAETGEELLRQAQIDPDKVVDATADLDAADASYDTCQSWRARGIALRILDRVGDALDALAVAQRLASSLDDHDLEAGCLRSMAPLVAHAGRVDDAFALLDDAERIGGPSHRADVEFQRAGVALLIADWRRSFMHYTRAIDAFRTEGRDDWVPAALLGRGLMAAYAGDRAQAESDLNASAAAFDALDDDIGVAQALWNLALAQSLTGDPARAVIQFEDAAQRFDATSFPIDLFLSDQSEALFAVGLHEEALSVANRCLAAYASAVEESEGTTHRRNVLDAARCELELARMYAFTGSYDQAADHAAQARIEFQAHGQLLRALFAELVVLDVDANTAHAPAQTIERAEAVRRQLQGSGQSEWLAEALLIQARCHRHLGNLDEARSVLGRVAKSQRSATQELTRLELVARVALDRDDSGAALRAARRAVRTVRSRSRLVGSSLVEASLTRKIDAVVDIALGVLLSAGRGRAALDLADEADQMQRSARPATDADELLIEHRSLTRAIDEAANDMRDPTPIIERRQALERRIRAARTELADEASTVEHRRGDLHLARWFQADDKLWLVQATTAGTTVTDLGRVEATVELLDELAFLIRRAFRSPGASRLAAVDDVAAAIDDALGLARIRRTSGESTSVVLHLVAAPQLPTIPFGFLPSLRGATWVRADRVTGAINPTASSPRSSTDTVTLIGGPGLEHASDELTQVGSQHPRETVTSTAGATCAQARSLLESSELCHVAAHSRLNEGNPMFSSIQFADGDLSLHELEALARQPSVAVMASCESARGDRIGLQSLGISSALLAAGIDVVIGTALPIPDSEATVAVMAQLHESLRSNGAVGALAAMDRSAFSPSAELIADCLLPCVRAPAVAMP